LLKAINLFVLNELDYRS